ncbi:hypothetical protein [Stenotrophomonas rhizophila]|uniref:hypothetical protein n=1 Tax=Stenotrophomonas rhizophila TaxID=216778 RepID=UPI001E59A3D4|nr:hypothetical protein [Stenotrophomonas rhizophila]MCC7634810.1 hypothetical protein [Stenotrophomonas rhizophila]MCC7664517.1 hypothetical protein [Stenotrophomonas rhizophila]
MALNPHPSLQALALECSEWLENARKKGKAEQAEAAIQKFLDTPGALHQKAAGQLNDLALVYDVRSCDAFFRSDIETLAVFVQRAVRLRALFFRWMGMYSDMRQDLGNWPREFSDSMMAMGPSMLSWWTEGSVCAQRYIEMAEKDQRINTMPEMRRIRNSTSDVFAVALFSAGFEIPTRFEPLNPLIPEYRAVLDAWNTDDQLKFQTVMQVAAEFHISRSRESTDRQKFEFDATMDRVFPAELLAIQALRRRHGLPEFETNHSLVDASWKVLRDITSVAAFPLAQAVEERLIKDYPQFR